MEVETDDEYLEDASSNCLICRIHFESKPNIILEDEGSEEHLLQFKAAFRLFCKLLKTYQQKTDDEEEENYKWMTALTKFFTAAWKLETILQETLEETSSFRTFTRPCCDNCHGTLVNIYKLQKIIEDNQASQQALVESLGKALMHEKEHPSKSLTSPSKKRRTEELQLRGLKPTSKTTTRTKTKDLAEPSRTRGDCQLSKTCFVKLKRCDDVDSKEGIASSIHRNSSPPSQSARVVRKSKLQACDEIRKSSGNRTRLVSKVSKEEPLDVDDNDYDSDEYVPPGSPSCSTSNRSPTFLNEDSDSKADDDSDCSNPATETGPIPAVGEKMMKKTVFGQSMKRWSQYSNLQRRPNRSNWIFLIGEETLFYKNSMATVSRLENTMTCTEPGCNLEIQGLDYSSFQQLRLHIESHMTEGYGERIRQCPICKRKCGSDVKFHFVKHHRHEGIYTLCEVCWKPFHNPDKMRQHLWSHKSCEEKEDAESRGDSETRCDFKKVNDKPPPVKMRNRVKTKECKKRKRGRTLKAPLCKTVKKTKGRRICTRLKVEPETCNWFVLIQENTLLFKNSLIDATLRQKMTCLEEGCGWNVNESDYNSFQQARDHVNKHSDEEDYDQRKKACPVCDGVFPAAELWHHLKKHHKPLIHLICDYCWREFDQPSHIQLHFACHKKPEKGDILNLMDTKPTEIDKREKIRRRVWLKNQKAQILPIYRRSNGLWRLTDTHLLLKCSLIKVNHADQRVECEEEDCGVSFEGTNYSAFLQIRAHINNCHLDEPTYTTKLRNCPACEIGFYGPTLKTHAVSSHNSSIICEICWKPFEDDECIRAHKWRHKSDQEKEEGRAEEEELKNNRNRKYDKSRKSRKSRAEKSKGIPIAKTTTTFSCDTCGKEFKNASDLRAHLPRHLPKEVREKFECSYCGCKVLNAITLRTHIQRNHRPDLMTRQHVCSICDKKFHIRDGDHYRRHVRRHTNEKPFVCETCGKGFVSNEQLKLHSNVHLDQRSYQCEFCEMAYKHKSNLQRHQKSAHKEKMPETDPEVTLRRTMPEYRPDFIGPKLMFPCEICEKVFPLRSRMTKHVKLVHPNVSF